MRNLIITISFKNKNQPKHLKIVRYCPLTIILTDKKRTEVYNKKLKALLKKNKGLLSEKKLNKINSRIIVELPFSNTRWNTNRYYITR